MPPMRALLVAMLLLASGCVLFSSGPDCAAACDKVVHCPGVSGTFLLSCNDVNGDCYDVVADCAVCLSDKSCDEIASGACDAVCRPPTDGGT